PGQTERRRARGQRGLLADTCLEVGVRPPQPLRDPPGDVADLALERLVDDELAAGRPREELDRPVVMRRAEPARDDAEIGSQPFAEGSLQLLRPVADDRDPRRLEAEAKRLAREKRAVPVGPLAADELAAGDDERGARPARKAQPAVRTRLKPLRVTTTARPSGKARRVPFSVAWR